MSDKETPASSRVPIGESHVPKYDKYSHTSAPVNTAQPIAEPGPFQLFRPKSSNPPNNTGTGKD